MKILIIEDDRILSFSLQTRLADHGFQADVCDNGNDGLFYLRHGNYQLILLDRMLPILDGAELLRIIRQQNITIPVIFITGLGDLSAKVTGLNLGADDYLVKPFAFEELLARIHCVLRRPQELKLSRPLSVGDLVYDPLSKRLSRDTLECTLTAKEGELMQLFLDHPGQILTRSILLSEVWGEDSEVESGNLDNFIYFLRNRLRRLGSRTQLKTVRGTGYQLIL